MDRLILIACSEGAPQFSEHFIFARHEHPTPLFLFLNNGDDLVIPSLTRERDSSGRLVVWADSRIRIRTDFHQQPHHFGHTAEHRVMQGSVLMLR